MILYQGPVTGPVDKLARALVAQDMWWVAGQVLWFSKLWPSWVFHLGQVGQNFRLCDQHCMHDYNISEAESEKVEFSVSWIYLIILLSVCSSTQFGKSSVFHHNEGDCFPIFQYGFQLFKLVNMILYQGPVTGPVYRLARALVLRTINLFCFCFPIFQDLLSNFSSQPTWFCFRVL